MGSEQDRTPPALEILEGSLRRLGLPQEFLTSRHVLGLLHGDQVDRLAAHRGTAAIRA